MPGAQDLRAMACALAIVIWHCGIGAYWVFSNDFGRALGINGVLTGQALAIGMACGIPGALLPALLPRRIAQGGLFGAGMALQLASIVTMHLASGWPTYAAAVIAWNFSWNFSIPYILSLFAITDRDNRLIRLSPAAQGLGLAIGPAVGGTLVADQGLSAVLAFYALTVIAAFGIYCWVASGPTVALHEADHV
jgi:predicted MFS family arabinose efflux permease